ncbi:MAG: G1 family glutamic endopeptidase [Acidimicrobiales bacterium]
MLGAATAAVSFSLVVVGTGAGATAATVAATTPVVHGTRIPAPLPRRRAAVRGATAIASDNWSGYAQVSTTDDTFTQVTDTFVVPTVEASAKGKQFVADWVGIGGYSAGDDSLVQTGIQAVIKTKKRGSNVVYDAWTEHLPKAEQPLALTISAGDTVTATVQETATNTWLMEVTDVTTGLSAESTVSYVSSGLSAEAILERPCIKSPCAVRDLAHLAQTSNITFGPGSYSNEIVPAGQTPTEEPLLGTVAGRTLADIVMTDNSGTSTIATPSPPSTALDAFAVADGDVAPPPPTI